jgi:hypothetical protein
VSGEAGKGVRALLPLALAALLGGCGSPPGEPAAARVMVVDTRGAPIQGAFLSAIQEDENPSARPQEYTSGELRAQTSDPQGMIHAGLDDFLWESDHCYHFRRAGFEEVEMSVSRDLVPPVLRIEMKSLSQDSGSPRVPAGAGQGARRP